jgi:cell division protein ZapA (FtsZ GTPase activity inhibitor)
MNYLQIMANKQHETIIKVRGREYKISIDGLTPIEIGSLASDVEEKMKYMEEKTHTVDTSKLAVLVAIDYASELYNLHQKIDANTQANAKKVDTMISSLHQSLDKE